MLSKSLIVPFGIAAAALIAPAVQATNFTVGVVLDPTTFMAGQLNQVDLPDTLSIGVGDTVDLTITFTGGAAFSLANSGTLWTGLLSDTVGSVDTDGVLSFIGGSPNLMTTSTVSQNNEYAHAGNQYGPSDYLASGTDVSFTGIEQVFTITGNDAFTYLDGTPYPAGPDPRSYYGAFFYYQGDGSGGTSAAPEPASWAMMLVGFGAVGGAMRSRRKAAISFG